jgi:WNK lysine deficient protein kinase
MAPEMYSELYDESIDVYAFGMCLLEMATGEYPYQECTKPFEIYKRVTQGIKPENYNRIDNDDLKELIFLCIRLKTNQRPNVKELVNHSWFLENNGLKLEVHKDEAQNIIHKNVSQVTFRLKVSDKSKRKLKWPENEEIEFLFDVDNDNTEQIVKELKESTAKITDEDFKYLVQAIKDKSKVSKLEREDVLEKQDNDDKTTLINNIPSSNAPSTVSSIAGPAQIYGTNNVNELNSNQQPAQQQNQQQVKQINVNGANQIQNDSSKVTTTNASLANEANQLSINKIINEEDSKTNQINFIAENENQNKQPNQGHTNYEQSQNINNINTNGIQQDEESFSSDPLLKYDFSISFS